VSLHCVCAFLCVVHLFSFLLLCLLLGYLILKKTLLYKKKAFSFLFHLIHLQVIYTFTGLHSQVSFIGTISFLVSSFPPFHTPNNFTPHCIHSAPPYSILPHQQPDIFHLHLTQSSTHSNFSNSTCIPTFLHSSYCHHQILYLFCQSLLPSHTYHHHSFHCLNSAYQSFKPFQSPQHYQLPSYHNITY